MIGIDLGSNTIRFIEYSNGKFTKEYEEVVRTAEDMHKTSIISNEAKLRIVNAIESGKKCLEFKDVTAVATAAFRNAKNAQEVKKEIFEKTGVNFTIIPPLLEAKLTTLAVKEESQKFVDTNIIMTDIGGASTEIAFLGGDNFFYNSLDLGIVISAQRYENQDDLKQYIESFKEQFDTFLKQIDTKDFIIASTAGTPTTLAALKQGLTFTTYDKKKVSGTTLNLEEIGTIKKQLLSSSTEDLTKLVGVGREDLISTGITIFEEIIKLLNRRETYIFDNSLREGIIYGKLKGLL